MSYQPKSPVEGDDATTMLKASKDMPSCLINRDKHRVALFGVEYLGGNKAGAYIAKNSGDMLHTGVLRKSLNITALHTLCCRVGGC